MLSGCGDIDWPDDYVEDVLDFGWIHNPPIEKWPDGKVKYYFHNVPNLLKLNFHLSMEEWERSGIEFIEVDSSTKDALKISDGWETCRTTVGYFKNGGYLHYCSSSVFKELITHELGHAIGMRHEHQRPDRDEYINIHWSNINPLNSDEFEITENSLVIYDKYEYDYDSIMHYHPSNYSINGMDTFTIIDETVEPNYINVYPTDDDIAKVAEIYDN